MSLVNSNYNQVTGCTSEECVQKRLQWNQPRAFPDANIIHDNHLMTNQYSIYILNCQSNVVYANTIENSTVAVNLMEYSKAGYSTPSNNYFYLNSFINNSRQFSLMDLDVPPPVLGQTNDVTGYFNYWSYSSYGNYWSDYTTKYPNANGT